MRSLRGVAVRGGPSALPLPRAQASLLGLRKEELPPPCPAPLSEDSRVPQSRQLLKPRAPTGRHVLTQPRPRRGGHRGPLLCSSTVCGAPLPALNCSPKLPSGKAQN